LQKARKQSYQEIVDMLPFAYWDKEHKKKIIFAPSSFIEKLEQKLKGADGK